MQSKKSRSEVTYIYQAPPPRDPLEFWWRCWAAWFEQCASVCRQAVGGRR
jgi:hypothetical protein